MEQLYILKKAGLLMNDITQYMLDIMLQQPLDYDMIDTIIKNQWFDVFDWLLKNKIPITINDVGEDDEIHLETKKFSVKVLVDVLIFKRFNGDMTLFEHVKIKNVIYMLLHYHIEDIPLHYTPSDCTYLKTLINILKHHITKKTWDGYMHSFQIDEIVDRDCGLGIYF